jgi:hypothetical protein
VSTASSTGGTDQAPSLARRLLVFVALQGAMSTFLALGSVVIVAEQGLSAAVTYSAWFVTAIAISLVAPFLVARWVPLSAGALVRASFAIPAVLLPWSVGQPEWQACAMGGYIGMSWCARQSLELGLLRDEERDLYASQVTAWTVTASLLTTALVSVVLLQAADETRALYAFYSILAMVGVVLAGRRLPAAPAAHLDAPWAVMRQPAYRRCLPLYGLESGLWGINIVTGASGAVQVLEKTSTFAGLVSLATVAGAVSLWVMRHRRHAGNRLRWMGLACIGMVVAHAMVAVAVAWPQWPLIYGIHLLLLAAVTPFWQASEQVLNQRLMDLHGSLADRIAVREISLWGFRFSGLWVFWWLFGHWTPAHLLMLSTALVVLCLMLEWWISRHWLSGDASTDIDGRPSGGDVQTPLP